jgi:predicted nucleotidyltransferase
MVTEEIRGIVDEFARKLSENHIDYDSLILFGSYAKGNFHKDSDMDIAVISSQFGKNRLLERIKLMKISSKVDSRIEPHPVSLIDWEEGWKQIVYEIKKTGIKIAA